MQFNYASWDLTTLLFVVCDDAPFGFFWGGGGAVGLMLMSLFFIGVELHASAFTAQAINPLLFTLVGDLFVDNWCGSELKLILSLGKPRHYQQFAVY